ncbi:MAG: alpha/beta fold hydrolase [Actinomycetota bacterium]|nr:alpha/beta fold hydrolase [Actinomycetota bacterium]
MTRVHDFERDGLTFHVRDKGPQAGTPVILLHGFPETSRTWDLITPALTDARYRVLAPDQRGYSPGARPSKVRAYRIDELTADVLALADAAEFEDFHLVGHDWGGAVAWHLAANHPDRLRSLTVLSTPHPRAIAASLPRSTQVLRSSYIGLFRTPIVAERVLTFAHGAVLERSLRSSGLPPEEADALRDRLLGDDGALSAALAWYRAAGPLSLGRVGHIDVPTMFLWSTNDVALGGVAARGTEAWVRADYRFEVLDGVSHWIQREVPDRLAELLVEHLEDHEPATP